MEFGIGDSVVVFVSECYSVGVEFGSPTQQIDQR
jgi:hypothetical protein